MASLSELNQLVRKHTKDLVIQPDIFEVYKEAKETGRSEQEIREEKTRTVHGIDLNSLKEEVTGQYFDVCNWGSCQYSGALAMYQLLQQVQKTLDTKQLKVKLCPLAESKTPASEFEILGIRVSWDKIFSISETIERFRQKGIARESPRDDEYGIQNVKDFREAKLETITDCFNLTKGMAWDLWNAAPFIAECAFENLQIDILPANGQGPIMNIAAQSSNNGTGTYCYLLRKHGFVDNDIDAFNNFDT
jgi:hypothetical protein